jgi:hypothetical protein
MIRLGLGVAVLCMAVVLTQCGTSSGQPQAEAGPKDYGLIVAIWNDCAAQGHAVAVYLDTGKPLSDDPIYGSQRQAALALSGEQRALYIRRAADSLIQQCDRLETAQEQAAAQAKAAEDARVAAEAAKAAAAASLANKEANCKRVGANWAFYTLMCWVSYKANDGKTYDFTIAFDSNGNVAPNPNGPANAAACATYYGRGITGIWHSDTDVCSA